LHSALLLSPLLAPLVGGLRTTSVPRVGENGLEANFVGFIKD
jgi:hypothetical protein